MSTGEAPGRVPSHVDRQPSDALKPQAFAPEFQSDMLGDRARASARAASPLRMLVGIASYGRANDEYMYRLVHEYSSMAETPDIVVFSNVDKPVPAGVALVVGLPIDNPWSLPFAHRKYFAERANAYDVFIYSEDDTLITRDHIDAFLAATAELEEGEIAGFLRSEQAPDGTTYYSSIHNHFHWDPDSVRRRGDGVYAYFTNEHGACYMLTRKQLGRALASGGYLVEPHEGRYDMLVSAATDPYTQCGFRKLIRISSIDTFTCRHLTNKYIGRTGLVATFADTQIQALLALESGTLARGPSLPVEPTNCHSTRWIKSYYEPSRSDLIDLFPPSARRILSVGCGWGETELSMQSRGWAVDAIALDPVIGHLAATRGINVLPCAFEDVADAIGEYRYDGILLAGFLHLVASPTAFLARLRRLLAPSGSVVFSCPNTGHIGVRARALLRRDGYRNVGDFQASGVQSTSPGALRRWLEAADFQALEIRGRFDDRGRRYDRRTARLVPGLWAREFAVSAAPRR